MKSEPMYRKIYQDLYHGIQNGTYPVGSKLPSEKELSNTYGVSRITSQKAIEILADKGYVMRQPGKGTFVIETDGQTRAEDVELFVDNETSAEEEGEAPIQVGVIMDSLGVAFGCELLRGIEYECRRRGFLMQLRLTYGSMEHEKYAILDMCKSGVKGLIFMSVQDEAYNEEILKLYLKQFPMVLIDRELKGIPVPVVTTDNYNASIALTTRLIELGHEKICFVSNSSKQTSTVNERFTGYCHAMSSNGLVTDESLWVRNVDAYLPNEDDTIEEEHISREWLSEYVDAHPEVTAFYAAEYSMAKLMHEILEEKGLLKEKELAFFDSVDEAADMLEHYPHVVQKQYQMGVTATRMLAHRIRGEEVTGREDVPFETYF